MELTSGTTTKTGVKLTDFHFDREKEIIFNSGNPVLHYTTEGKGVNDYEISLNPFTSNKNPDIGECFNLEYHNRMKKVLDEIAAMPAAEADAIKSKLNMLEAYCNEELSDCFGKTVTADSNYAEIANEIRKQKHTEEKTNSLTSELNEALRKTLRQAKINDIFHLTSEDDMFNHIVEFNKNSN